MRKKKQGRKFSLKSDSRKALMKSLARALFLKERIKTTKAKAKELKRFAEKFLTKAKRGDLAAVRFLIRYFDKSTVKKLISVLGPRYKDRPGGYTRVINLAPRKSDGAKMAIIELVK